MPKKMICVVYYYVAKFLGSGKTPTFNKTLPVGNKENNYIAVIEVRVRNSAGETNHVDIPIKVGKVHHG